MTTGKVYDNFPASFPVLARPPEWITLKAEMQRMEAEWQESFRRLHDNSRVTLDDFLSPELQQEMVK